MKLHVNNATEGNSPAAGQDFSVLSSLWARLMELWLAAVLLAFFLIRILNSQTGQALLARFLKANHS